MVLLDIQNVSKAFGGLKAVNKVDLAVEEGQIYGVIGPNGAGKSTLFNTIAGKYRPTSGRIIFKDRDITKLAPHDTIRLGLARTFQHTLLFHEMSVLDNILVGLHAKGSMRLWECFIQSPTSKKRLRDSLARARELAAFLDLEECRDEPVKNLPHGHQQLLGIAIALATEPDLILLDEPSAGMNAEETQRLLLKIQEMNGRGMTVLLVAHDMKLVMNVCHRIAVLNFGSKIAEGVPDEVAKNGEVIKAYLGSRHAAQR
jgi:branched-chain amino acid transport system ATP-binding protein